MRQILGINYYFGPSDYNDAVFSPERGDEQAVGFVKKFKRWIEARYDVEVHTLDCVDYLAPEVKAVLYFDYSWRYALRDPFLRQIPFGKRALMMIEPENVNPSLYYVPWLRSRFSTVFTWDLDLQGRHPEYKPVNVPVGAEPSEYRDNRFADMAFKDKKMLVAISRNRWSYMHQSTYGKRKAAYAYFDAHCPDGFDLYGSGWNEPAVFYERWIGFPWYRAYRGVVQGGWNEKVTCMSRYRFALCFENNASQRGYISEKITDCFCARCVPVYYGASDVSLRIPQECWIDARGFSSLGDMHRFLWDMTPERHSEYVKAIDDFMHSPALEFFSTEHYFMTLAEGLGFKRKQSQQP